MSWFNLGSYDGRDIHISPHLRGELREKIIRHERYHQDFFNRHPGLLEIIHPKLLMIYHILFFLLYAEFGFWAGFLLIPSVVYWVHDSMAFIESKLYFRGLFQISFEVSCLVALIIFAEVLRLLL